MTQLPLATAQKIIEGAIAEARKNAFEPMGIVVVDAAGQLLAFAREDGATALRFDIALGKSCAAVGLSVASRVLTERAKTLPAFFNAIASIAHQNFIPQTGAVVIKDAAGKIIGAAGASGGTGDQDEQIVIAGVTAVGLTHG